MKLIKLHDVPEKGASHNPAVRKRVLVENHVIPRLTNYARAVFPPGEKANSHVHEDMAEIFTVESGSGEIRINDVAYVFAAGTTMVVEPGEIHEITNTGKTDMVITYFGMAVD